jgi:hypothetical protein
VRAVSRLRRLAPLLVTLLLLALVATACAAGPNEAAGTPPPDGDVAGFWLGLWHGIIGPITLIISLFTEDVSLYEVHNNGNFYDVGFFLGLGVLVGGSHGTR